MEIVKRKISDLNLAKYNPRKITDQELEGLKASIKKFGFIDPVIVNKRSNTICGGHQRVRCAELLGMDDVPTVEVDLSPTEEKALNIALNSPHISGKYDDDLLSILLAEIKIDFPEFDEFDDLRFGEFDLEISPTDQDLPDLGNGDDPDIQQKTFILSNDQAESVDRAISKMKKDSSYIEDGINSNSNGTALALVCERYV